MDDTSQNNTAAGVDAFIGRRIRALRTEAGLTQARAAAKLRLKAPALSAIETGRRQISLTELSDVCDRLGITLAQLLHVDPDEQMGSDTARRIRALRTGIPESVDIWRPKDELSEDEQRMLTEAARRRLEDRIINALGGEITRTELREAAVDAFDTADLLSVRDTQVALDQERPRPHGWEWGDDFPDMSPAGVAAARGHATRQIVAALRDRRAAKQWLDEQTAAKLTGQFIDPRDGRVTVAQYFTK